MGGGGQGRGGVWGEHSGLAAHNKGSFSCAEAQAPSPLRLVDGRSLAFHALATWLGLGLRFGFGFGFGFRFGFGFGLGLGSGFGFGFGLGLGYPSTPVE